MPNFVNSKEIPDIAAKRMWVVSPAPELIAATVITLAEPFATKKQRDFRFIDGLDLLKYSRLIAEESGVSGREQWSLVSGQWSADSGFAAGAHLALQLSWA